MIKYFIATVFCCCVYAVDDYKEFIKKEMNIAHIEMLDCVDFQENTVIDPYEYYYFLGKYEAFEECLLEINKNYSIIITDPRKDPEVLEDKFN